MKTEYGVRAVVELAANHGRGSMQSGEIARRQRIPGPFLDQVLMTLRRAGLIQSTRGPRGGHRLARRPEEIRLDEVIECLEGTTRTSRPEGETEAGDSQVLAQVTARAERAAEAVFAATSMADCLAMRRAQGAVFHGIFKPVGAGPKGAR